jgi:hypothetical protein
MFRRAIPVLLALALPLTACDLRIDLPVTQEIGPTVVEEIVVEAPADPEQTSHLSLAFGAGTLKLNPGSDSLVSGTATFNVADFDPDVTVAGSNVRIEQGNWRLTGIPDMSRVKNEWDLLLGGTPIDLKIEAGAYKAEYELGGLALTNLTVRDGAAEADLSFSEPNATEMALLRYETGASNVTLSGLGNANFASLEFDSGAGNYTLDFSGELVRPGSVMIQTGLSNITLIIPQGVSTQVTVEGGLSNVTAGSGWSRNGSVYTQAGEGYGLTIVVEMGAGNLNLTR